MNEYTFNDFDNLIQGLMKNSIESATEFVGDMVLELSVEEREAITIKEYRDMVINQAIEFTANRFDPDYMNADIVSKPMQSAIRNYVKEMSLEDLF